LTGSVYDHINSAQCFSNQQTHQKEKSFNMSDQAQVPKKNILTSSKLRLSAPSPVARGQYGSLNVEIFNGNPRFVARTGDPAEKGDRAKDYGRIQAPVDLPVFFAIIEMIRQAVAAPGEWKRKVECYNHDYVDGKRSQDIMHIADIIVGKDAERVVFMSVISKKQERAVIKFPFGPSDQRYHRFIGQDGTPLPKPELSNMFALAWVNMLEGLIPLISNDTYVPPPPPTGGQGGGFNRGGGQGGGFNRGGGQGGGFNRGAQGGGGYNRAPADAPARGQGASANVSDMSDDIPF
jgi:uncharacterized membrane protein YgcG